MTSTLTRSLEDTDDPYHSCILDVPLEFEVAKETNDCHSLNPSYRRQENQMTIKRDVGDPRIVAIGETNLDKLKGPSTIFRYPCLKNTLFYRKTETAYHSLRERGTSCCAYTKKPAQPNRGFT